jgi:hypothetical protein
MGKVFTIGIWVIGAAIVADLLANPGGTQAAASGITAIETPALQASAGQKIA